MTNVKSAEQSFLRALISPHSLGMTWCTLSEIHAKMPKDLNLLDITTIRDTLVEEGNVEKVTEKGDLHTITENGEFAAGIVW